MLFSRTKPISPFEIKVRQQPTARHSRSTASVIGAMMVALEGRLTFPLRHWLCTSAFFRDYRSDASSPCLDHATAATDLPMPSQVERQLNGTRKRKWYDEK